MLNVAYPLIVLILIVSIANSANYLLVLEFSFRKVDITCVQEGRSVRF